MSDCPFCKIASGEAQASMVYEDENVLAFMDLNPASTGHTLVVPREHWETIFETPEEILAEIIGVIKRVSVASKKTVEADGVKIIQLNGRAAGQVVMHLHFHVIPISSNSGRTIGTHGRKRSEKKELDEIAKNIRENL